MSSDITKAIISSDSTESFDVPLQHGNCPSCGVSLDGSGIWQHFYEKYGTERQADETAELYGASRTKGRWGRAIGIYDLYKDRTVQWKCPDCGHIWDRN